MKTISRPRFHLWWILVVAGAAAAAALLSGCMATVEIPIGKDGRYGAALVGVGYRPPATPAPTPAAGKAVVAPR